MTSLYDPSRRRIGTTPTLANRNWIVPRLTIWPDETPELVRISAMIPADETDSYTAREVSATTGVDMLPDILACYRSNPELFLENFFHISLDKKGGTRPKQAPKHPVFSDSDIGV